VAISTRIIYKTLLNIIFLIVVLCDESSLLGLAYSETFEHPSTLFPQAMKKNYSDSPAFDLLGSEAAVLSKHSIDDEPTTPASKKNVNAYACFRLLVILLLLSISAVSQAQVSPGGLYALKNFHSSKVLEVSGGSLANGAGAQQWDMLTFGHQLWLVMQDTGNPSYIKFVNRNSGLVLEVANGSLATGAVVQQGNDNGTLAQRWGIIPVAGTGVHGHDARYNIRNVNSNKLLEIAGASLNSGEIARQWDSTAGTSFFTTAHQEWTFDNYSTGGGSATYDGAYVLFNIYSGKYLSLGAGLVMNAGAPVGLYSTYDMANAEWLININDGGATTYEIRNRESFFSLSTANSSTLSGAGLEHNPSTYEQYKWIITTVAPDRVRISPDFNSSLYVGVTSTANGAQATINTLSANPTSQEWLILRTGAWRAPVVTPVSVKQGVYTLSPNPAANEVVIQAAASTDEQIISTVLVYDNYGKLRLKQAIGREEGAIRLHLDTLPAGLYTVHLLNSTTVVDRQKLQVKR
jgi:hypothetical protein